MGYLGYKPADKPLTSADITDSIITSAKITDGTIANADITINPILIIDGAANIVAMVAVIAPISPTSAKVRKPASAIGCLSRSSPMSSPMARAVIKLGISSMPRSLIAIRISESY